MDIAKIPKLISEGYSLKDKILIGSYYVKALFVRDHKMFGNVMLKNREGIYFCGNNTLTALTASTMFEPEMREYFKLAKGAFIDVGANIGKYSVVMGLRYPKNDIVAVEPIPENVYMLEKNVRLNGLDVKIVPKACYSHNGLMEIMLDDISTGRHSFVRKNKSGHRLLVEIETLDNIVKRLSIRRIDLIKIDVEGVESEVLKGATDTITKSKPTIICEAWDRKRLESIQKVLKPFGYDSTQISEEYYIFGD